MLQQRSLASLLDRSRENHPNKTAVSVPGSGSLTYLELSDLTDRLRDRLWRMGVGPGDRVGFRLHKSIDSLAAVFGILKTGAAYVPVDADSPAARGAYILNNCGVKVLITETGLQEQIKNELDSLNASPHILAINPDSSHPLDELLTELQNTDPAEVVSTVDVDGSETAYILYTSGSTGNPKGVVLTHNNAFSFIDWCSEIFTPTHEDRFSSHAPFHFDLSILDIYLSVKHGATLVLITEALGKDPLKLAEVIAEEKITSWYSTPSILSLLANYGKLEKYDYSSLRTVMFAGEVFPIPQYLILHDYWTDKNYYNLYGPTETNVCTWYQVPRNTSELKSMDSFPIGKICPPNLGIVVDENDHVVEAGEEGELLVHGSNVMGGYWKLDEQNAKAFLTDDEGKKWYRTGDIVRDTGDGNYVYVSRRDRMVKRRGYRVELGEIEVAMGKNPDLREVAVISIPDSASGVKVKAFVCCKEGKTSSIIALKSHASKNLPPYMIPDVFSIMDKLPRTSTDKIDYQALKTLANS